MQQQSRLSQNRGTSDLSAALYQIATEIEGVSNQILQLQFKRDDLEARQEYLMKELVRRQAKSGVTKEFLIAEQMKMEMLNEVFDI